MANPAGENASDAPLHVAWKVKALTSADGPDVSCVVLDVSAGGARLSVPDDAALPDRFTLFSPITGQTHEAEVRWRDTVASEVAVTFLQPNGSADASDLSADAPRIIQLEEHVKHLDDVIRRTESRVAALAERLARLEAPI